MLEGNLLRVRLARAHRNDNEQCRGEFPCTKPDAELESLRTIDPSMP